ncbi:hypothetical protein [Cohnella sp. GCM10012308]|uniref:hypothetical protein n=1 Tax=Cohnella sp. GCM10012308 TaxID=3317329 RepID=UPI00361F2E32
MRKYEKGAGNSGDSVVLAGAARLPSAGKRLLAALWLVVLLFTIGMLAAGWPRYWVYVAAETTPQAWLESVLLVLAAAVAALNAVVASLEKGSSVPSRGFNGKAVGTDPGTYEAERVAQGAHGTERTAQGAYEAEKTAQGADGAGKAPGAPWSRRKGRAGRLADARSAARGRGLSGWIARHAAWGWTITAAAFAWLALDERFALHERLRDRYLKQTGIRLLPWMEAGDWLIPLYAVCGLAAVWALWRLLGRGIAARVFFAAGLVVAFCAVSMDTIDIRSLGKDSERLLQTIEECLETAAMAAFVSAFLSVLTGRLSAWYNKTSIRRDMQD